MLDRVVKTIFTTSVLSASMMMLLVLPKQKERKQTLSLSFSFSLSLSREPQGGTPTKPEINRHNPNYKQNTTEWMPTVCIQPSVHFLLPSSKHKARTWCTSHFHERANSESQQQVENYNQRKVLVPPRETRGGSCGVLLL